jgi:hypothetical protein
LFKELFFIGKSTSFLMAGNSRQLKNERTVLLNRPQRLQFIYHWALRLNENAIFDNSPTEITIVAKSKKVINYANALLSYFLITM